jgi:hypothetical protein
MRLGRHRLASAHPDGQVLHSHFFGLIDRREVRPQLRGQTALELLAYCLGLTHALGRFFTA